MPAPACAAPAAASAAAPSMPGEPATTATAVAHLCVSRARRGTQGGHVGVLHQGDAPVPSTGTPMSATTTSPASRRPSPWSRPGFSAAKVTVRSAAIGCPEAAPVSPSTPEGMSTASTSAPAGTAGRVVAAPEAGAVGGVDHQVAAGQPVGRAGGVDHRHPGAAPAQDLGGHPAVGAVVALAGHHHHPAPVARPEQPQGRQGHRRPGPVHQRVLVDVVEGGGVGRPHLGHGGHRAHQWSSLGHHHGHRHLRGVGERDVPAATPAAGRARSAAPAGQSQRRRAPRRRSRTTSTSRQGEAAEAAAQRLHHRLLGGEAGRQAARPGPGRRPRRPARPR